MRVFREYSVEAVVKVMNVKDKKGQLFEFSRDESDNAVVFAFFCLSGCMVITLWAAPSFAGSQKEKVKRKKKKNS